MPKAYLNMMFVCSSLTEVFRFFIGLPICQGDRFWISGLSCSGSLQIASPPSALIFLWNDWFPCHGNRSSCLLNSEFENSYSKSPNTLTLNYLESHRFPIIVLICVTVIHTRINEKASDSHSFSTFFCNFELVGFFFLYPQSNMCYFSLMIEKKIKTKNGFNISITKPVTTYAMSGNDVPIIWATQKRWNEIGENFEKHKFLIPISPGSQ